MATREIVPGRGVALSLSPREAVELIALLVAQLANVPLVGRMSGACPTINIVEHGQSIDCICFAIESSKKDD